MATFPKEEGNIFTLGQEMSAGLKANSETFPTRQRPGSRRGVE